MIKKIKKWFVDILGFYKSSDYIKQHMEEANVRSALYMSIVVVVLEVWMIIRYIDRYVLSEEYQLGFSEVMYYTRNFWVMLSVGILMLVFCILYFRGKVKSMIKSRVLISIFAAVCLAFGIYVSFYDFIAGKQILAFLTMVTFVACLLIWKPYVSIVMFGAIFGGFYALLANKSGVEILSGDQVNYITFFISLTMVSINLYHQRYKEAANAEKLNRIIVTDDLTKISNMHDFVDTSRRVLTDEKTLLENKIFLFINIENFKTYNDQFGYVSGNHLLKKFAKRISEIFRGEPYARQSDDHFVALTDVAGLEDKINSIDGILSDSLSEVSEVYMAVKIGGYRPKKRTGNPRGAVDRARYACGLIKNQYGKVYKEFDEELNEEYKRRQYVVNNIDNAVKKGYIKAYYQPVVWSDSKELCGCEALARWEDPEYGLLSPATFIPVLEECRQIHKLDACIFECACRDMFKTMEEGGPFVPVSLNFSRLDFELMDDAVGLLEGLVHKYNIPKDFIHVEITESALIGDDKLLKESIERFRKDGFAIWLDDFGSGYSSLNVLKDYKFDVLKIDMVFLNNFDENDVTKDILQCIIELAERIGMKTLTEGVETESEAQFLHDVGCERLQGYLYGKPVPYEEFNKNLSNGRFTISERVL